MATLPNDPQNQANFAVKVIPSDTINIPQPYIKANRINTSFIGATLIDGSAQFEGMGTSIPAVQPGDTVYNETTDDIATVVSVDSNTQLTLSAAIFTAAPEEYTIYQTNPEPNAFLLYVGTGGDINIETSAELSVIMKNVGDASFIPINVGRVNSSLTTASDIIALM